MHRLSIIALVLGLIAAASMDNSAFVRKVTGKGQTEPQRFYPQSAKGEANPEQALERSFQRDSNRFIGLDRRLQDWYGASVAWRLDVRFECDASQAFHLWEIEWVPERIAFYVDGKELHRFSEPEIIAELQHPQEVKANIWISSAVPWVGKFNERSLPVESVYEWMAAYRLDE